MSFIVVSWWVNIDINMSVTHESSMINSYDPATKLFISCVIVPLFHEYV